MWFLKWFLKRKDLKKAVFHIESTGSEWRIYPPKNEDCITVRYQPESASVRACVTSRAENFALTAYAPRFSYETAMVRERVLGKDPEGRTTFLLETGFGDELYVNPQGIETNLLPWDDEGTQWFVCKYSDGTISVCVQNRQIMQIQNIQRSGELVGSRASGWIADGYMQFLPYLISYPLFRQLCR